MTGKQIIRIHTAAGVEDLDADRLLVQNDEYVLFRGGDEVRDGAGAKLLRLNTNDPRCERIGTVGTSPVRFKVMVTGADMPSLPVEVASAALFRNATDTEPIVSGAVPGALLYLPTDRVAVITPVYVPGE